MKMSAKARLTGCIVCLLHMLSFTGTPAARVGRRNVPKTQTQSADPLLPPQTKPQIFNISKSISHNICLGEQALNETRDTVKQLEAEQAQLLEYWERDGVLMSEREFAIGRRSAVREVQSRLRRDK